MISLRKLASLKDDTRRRKCLRLVRDMERGCAEHRLPDAVYLKGLCALIASDPQWPEPVRKAAGETAREATREGGADRGAREGAAGRGIRGAAADSGTLMEQGAPEPARKATADSGAREGAVDRGAREAAAGRGALMEQGAPEPAREASADSGAQVGAVDSGVLMEESAPERLEALERLRRSLNALGHAMAGSLGVEWADWDAWMPGDSAEEYTPKFPFRVYLDGLRSPFNVGSVMRTAVAFGAERLWVSPECASPLHPRCRRSAMGADGRLSWQTASLDDLTGKETGTLFALELGGTSLSDFHFPSSGTVILGSEELGVRPELMRRAESDAGVVSIALPGPKASLNVGVAFGILMQRWCEYVQTAGDS